MPLEQIAVKRPLFEASKKPGKEHLEWCTDLGRIPVELPNVDKEIKTEKIMAKVYDEEQHKDVEKEINFPITEQSFTVDGYGYKLFSDKTTLEVRLMRWKSSGRGSSRAPQQPILSDYYFGWFKKDEREKADAKIKELNDQGFQVEVEIITWTEKDVTKDVTETLQAIRGRKPYNSPGQGQSQDDSGKQQQGQTSTAGSFGSS